MKSAQQIVELILVSMNQTHGYKVDAKNTAESGLR